MADKKPRQVVEDLQGGLPQIMPAADPRTADNYYRPQDQTVMRPPTDNPMTQLSHALSSLEPSLNRLGSTLSEKYTKEEYAKGEQEFWANREKWNAEIRAGRLPEGASPYFQRGLMRASLKQLSEDFHAQVQADFYGEAGAAARLSNDPTIMRQFLDGRRKEFSDKYLNANGKSLYSALDMQEVLHPAVSQTEKHMLATHAAYRVSEREKEYVDLASSRIQNLAEQAIGQLSPTDDDATRSAWIAKAAQDANDVLYHPDTGIVRNGLSPAKGNEILIDTLTTQMIKSGRREYADVINAIKTSSGALIGKTQYAQAKILAAEEHITDQQMKLAHFNHWQQGLPFEAASRERTQQSWEKEDQRWARELDTWKKQDAKLAEDEVSTSLTRRLYEGLRAAKVDPAKGRDIIDDVMRTAEQVLPKEAEKLHSLVHTLTKQQSDFEDDQPTVSQMRLEMSRNPLAFDINRIDAAVRDKLIKSSTAMQLYDDLERNRQNGDHPFLRQPEFTQMMHKVEKSMAQAMGEDEFGEGALRAVDAHADFRDLALEWIEKNPQGSAAAFNVYMRSKIKEVAERNNEPFGQEERRKRNEQETLGKQKVSEGQKAHEQREQTRQQAEAVLQKKQAEEKRRKDEIDHFNQNFKPTGKKTKDGRQYLQGPDGSIASEQTITIKGVPEINGGGITNIPTIFNGKKYSDEDAVDIVRQNKGKDPDTGKPLKRYYSIKDAEIAAREKSNRLGQEFKQNTPEKKPDLPTGPVSQYHVTPQHLRTLLTGEQKREIAGLRNRVLKPGVDEKPVTEEQLKDRVMEILKPIYKDAGAPPSELANGVSEFMRVLLPKQDKKKG